MHELDKPEFLTVLIGSAVVGGFFIRRLFEWVKSAPVHPDPWDEATEAAVQSEEAVQVCHHCLTPAEPGQWFCEHCGSAVGPYNNLMPFVNLFSAGEVFRNGVRGHLRVGICTVVGYVSLSVAFLGWVMVMRSIGLLLGLPFTLGILAVLVIFVRRFKNNLRRSRIKDAHASCHGTRSSVNQNADAI